MLNFVVSFSHFVKNLEKCIENPVELANLFKKYDRKFQMYTRYCQNKPKSEYIVSEYVETYIEVNSPYLCAYLIFLSSSSLYVRRANLIKVIVTIFPFLAIIEKSKLPDGRWKRCNFCNVIETSYKVDGLTENCQYEFRVSAKNAIGNTFLD